MAKHKWAYVAKGHYSTQDGAWTIHVLDNGAVYKTHPSRATADVTGSKADRYIESVPAKFHVRGKKRAKPEPEPVEKRETPKKEKKAAPPDKPKKTKRATKKNLGEAAKKLAKGAGAVIGTTRAFVTGIGEAEERAYVKRKAPPPKKKVTAPEIGHPLEYLISGTGALPPTGRKTTPKRRREQTLEEYLGY